MLKRVVIFWQGLALFCFLAGGALGQIQRVVRVSPSDMPRSVEASVAINPTDPANVVVVAQGRRPGSNANNYSFHSLDSGASWKAVPAFNTEQRTQGDDSVVFDKNGNAFHAYISFSGLFQKRPRVANNGIFVSRSTDKGATWEAPVAVVDHLNSVTPFEDKPYLAVDRVEGSPHQGHLYLAWTRFDEYGSDDPQQHSQILFSVSRDGGETFRPPVRISDQGGDCRDDDMTVEGAVTAVGLKGEIFVIWAGPRGLECDVSLDGGMTFGQDRPVSDMPGGWSTEIKGLDRHNGFPVVGFDSSAGPNRGTLYVNWIDKRNGDLDVFLARSKDAGGTWSMPTRVNDDPIGNGREQFFSWMSVDPTDGSINIVFFDRRDQAGTESAVTMARSIDGGESFRNFKVDLEPFAWQTNLFFGDYSGIDSLGGSVVAVFPHFAGERQIAISAAIFQFEPGTHQAPRH